MRYGRQHFHFGQHTVQMSKTISRERRIPVDLLWNPFEFTKWLVETFAWELNGFHVKTYFVCSLTDGGLPSDCSPVPEKLLPDSEMTDSGVSALREAWKVWQRKPWETPKIGHPFQPQRLCNLMTRTESPSRRKEWWSVSGLRRQDQDWSLIDGATILENELMGFILVSLWISQRRCWEVVILLIAGCLVSENIVSGSLILVAQGEDFDSFLP